VSLVATVQANTKATVLHHLSIRLPLVPWLEVTPPQSTKATLAIASSVVWDGSPA